MLKLDTPTLRAYPALHTNSSALHVLSRHAASSYVLAPQLQGGSVEAWQPLPVSQLGQWSIRLST